MDLITHILLYVGAAITFATFALQGLAAITRITPSTRDDELVSSAQRYVKVAQRILGMIALDTGSTHKPKSGPTDGTGASINTSLVLVPILLACLVIGGCATAPPPTPQTPKQTLAYTESTFLAAVESANGLYRSGVLDAGQEARVDELINRGNAALVAAHAAIESGESGTVQSRLAAVDAVLVQLRTTLAQEATDEQ